MLRMESEISAALSIKLTCSHARRETAREIKWLPMWRAVCTRQLQQIARVETQCRASSIGSASSGYPLVAGGRILGVGAGGKEIDRPDG
jgi:hypothetical protein